MPKAKTKFTAQFVTKLGKTPIIINLPVDFSNAGVDSADALAEELSSVASDELQNLQENAVLKLKNKADLKRAFKAYAKANPPDASV